MCLYAYIHSGALNKHDHERIPDSCCSSAGDDAAQQQATPLLVEGDLQAKECTGI